MAERLRRWFASILSILFGSTIIGACAPAYIGPPPVPVNTIKGQVKDKDSAQVIADIRVMLIINSYTNSESSYTNGAYSFYTHSTVAILAVEDIDGVTNGTYLPTNYTVTLPDNSSGFTTNIGILMTTNTNG
ncbi:MAG: hypothetical protein HPY53_05635 [Brevinematales bacterium]|nr:hypothetical protein [Brevinematales bacterium]